MNRETWREGLHQTRQPAFWLAAARDLVGCLRDSADLWQAEDLGLLLAGGCLDDLVEAEVRLMTWVMGHRRCDAQLRRRAANAVLALTSDRRSRRAFRVAWRQVRGEVGTC